jgi:hypothetical protein
MVVFSAMVGSLPWEDILMVGWPTIAVLASRGKKQDPVSKITRTKRAGDVAQPAELCLASMKP